MCGWWIIDSLCCAEYYSSEQVDIIESLTNAHWILLFQIYHFSQIGKEHKHSWMWVSDILCYIICKDNTFLNVVWDAKHLYLIKKQTVVYVYFQHIDVSGQLNLALPNPGFANVCWKSFGQKHLSARCNEPTMVWCRLTHVPWTKWLLFHRGYFHMQFHECKVFYFD